MKYIPLLPSLTTYAKVDDSDFELVNEFNWTEIVSGNTSYAEATYFIGHSKKRIRMHRLISGYLYVDHVNSDGLDNRKENLRESNSSLNAANRRKPTTKNQSQYKGVSLRKTGKWKAQVTFNYKTYHLGTYSSEIDAAKAYDEAAFGFWGEHARLNFPRA